MNRATVKRIEPTYLGDGVYAQDDGFHLVLTTGCDDIEQARAVVYLDDEVRVALRKILDTFDSKGA